MFGFGKKKERLRELRDFYAGRKVVIAYSTGMPEIPTGFYWNVSPLGPPVSSSAGGGYRTVTLYTPEGASLFGNEIYIPKPSLGEPLELWSISNTATFLMNRHVIEEVVTDPLAGNYPPNKL